MNTCCDSKHIIDLVEMFEKDDKIYLVTKFAKGGDLLNYCMQQEDSNNWMSVERARHIFIQLAKGVRDMHKANLVHRDLKLLNIFMCDSTEMPRVKIGDLGLAAYLEPGSIYVKRAGTTAFMAPEVMVD